MPASTLRIIALVIVAASLLAMLLSLFNYLQDGKISSTLGISALLLLLGVLYYFSADKFGKKPVDAPSKADDDGS